MPVVARPDNWLQPLGGLPSDLIYVARMYLNSNLVRT